MGELNKVTSNAALERVGVGESVGEGDVEREASDRFAEKDGVREGEGEAVGEREREGVGEGESATAENLFSNPEENWGRVKR